MVKKAKYVYQLRGTGYTRAGLGSRTVSTNTVFTTKELAEQKIPKFRAQLTDPKPLMAIEDDDSLKIEVVPLEIVE